MRRPAALRAGAALVGATSLSGCIVAAFPVAAGVMGARQVLEKRAAARADRAEPVETPLATARLARAPVATVAARTSSAAEVPAGVSGDTDRFTAVLLDANELPAPGSAPPLASESGAGSMAPLPPRSPDGGDGFSAFARAALARDVQGARSTGREGAILVPGVSLSAPRFRTCDGTPPAVLIDLDEGTRTPARPLRAAPGLMDALRPLRERDIAVLWLTDLRAPPAELRAEMTAAGLWGEGDAVLPPSGPDDRKQQRRQAAAATHCVLAIAGSDRADADELYDYLRRPDAAALLEGNWGARWFVTPDPVAVSPSTKEP